MKTINISLPSKLREQADELVKQGYYASISDLVRDALRSTINQNEYNQLAQKAIQDDQSGLAITLKTPKDIDDFINTL